MRAAWTWVWVWVVACAVSAAEDGVRRALRAPAVYSVQSTLLLNAAERRDRDVGYRLEADLVVTPLHDPDPDPEEGLLLRFQLSGSTLLARGAHRAAEWQPRASLWDAGGGAPWLARLAPAGAVRALRLPAADDPHVRNYKRALTSLFQFQADEAGGGERNETDSSGECAVLYERAASGARKVKRACAADAGAGAGLAARRVARYTLGAGERLAALHAEEVLTLHDAVKLRSWHALSPAARAPAAAERAPPPGPLLDAELPLEAPPDADDDDYLDDDEDHSADVSEAIARHAVALGAEHAGGGGGAAAARALHALLPALARAPRAALERALHAAAPERLPGLCRALGLAATPAAAAAAAAFLRLDAPDAPDAPPDALARAFLAGLALAHRPHPDAARLALRAAERARAPAARHAALLAAAAAARRAGAGSGAAAAARDLLARELARCGDDACRAARLHALANLRAAGADALAARAEAGAPREAAAALAALRRAPDAAPAHLRRVAALAVNASLPLELRAAALELVVAARAAAAGAAAPLQLLELATALHAERGARAHELRRVLWQRLEALGEAPPVRALLAVLPRRLRTWDARAHAGTSHVLRRALRWGGGAGGWRAALDSVQVARGGVLRRGVVSLLALPPTGAEHAELEVEVWTRGLHALAPAAAAGEGEEEEEEEMAGGLALTVGGARLPDIDLFTGQAELIGHVWAGTGAAPTGVLRAARVAHAAAGALPLASGVWARAGSRAVLALALDAHAAVSLWQRTARGALALRAALDARAGAAVSAPWAALRARRSFAAEPRLRIALDLDFYSGVALCVRAAEPAHAARDRVRLAAVAGARRLNVTRDVRAARALPPRTLALGRANDAACRTLRAADDDDDADADDADDADDAQ